MSTISRSLTALAAGTLLCIGAVSPAIADDTEIFISQINSAGVRPNILFVIDTSGSMGSTITLAKPPYDAATVYPGACSTGRVYWSTGSGNPPTCGTSRYIDAAYNACGAAEAALNSGGFWFGRAAQFYPSGGGGASAYRWRDLSSSEHTSYVECQNDWGVHGVNAAAVAKYPKDRDPSNPWTTNPGDSRILSWSSRNDFTLYSGNYVNWYRWSGPATSLTRLQAVQSVASQIANTVNGVNLGLMRFSDNGGFFCTDNAAQGGMVTKEMVDVNGTGNRASLVATINSYNAGGCTPLSETLYEAGQYYAGNAVDYGNTSAPSLSVAASRSSTNANQYQSPIQYKCQKNYIVLLTDGLPTADTNADAKIQALVDKGSPAESFASLVGSCDGTGDGRCLDDMAEYLFKGDHSPLAGRQNITTYTVGMGPGIPAGTNFLDSVATRGGGKNYTIADDVTELTDTLQKVFSDILSNSTTFTTPTVAVNAFNRAQTQNDLFVSVFRPASELRWPGNIKKYKLVGGKIVDVNNADAIDPGTGFFQNNAQSYWSPSPDGPNVEPGGAANLIDNPSARNLLTQVVSGGPMVAFNTSNAAITDAMLGITGPAPLRDDLILWARGQDIKDRDVDGDTTEPRRTMGDPLHGKPAIVTYGGTTGSPDPDDTVIFAPDNDGYLHAIDVRETSPTEGRELWAFVPYEMLGRMASLFDNPSAVNRTYGLDGDIKVLKFDVNNDGIVDPSAGDKVYLYFGLRRGGKRYYALDVTDRNNPVMLFTKSNAELPGLGESWSPPIISRVNVAGAAQNGEKLVLIFGGGYDAAQDSGAYGTDVEGHRIFMIDAKTGALLWFGGANTGSTVPPVGPSMAVFPKMENAITGRINVLDTNGDNYADRMYAADLGGRVHRFDIWNGNPANTLVTGGVMAEFGAAGMASPTTADTRRFYNGPDVALVQLRGADPYYNIAIGSGYRGHPLELNNHDMFFSFRDKTPFARFTQAQYNSFVPVKPVDLVDITPNINSSVVPATARGWRLDMTLNGGWVGEKILAESVTVNGVILFPTYQPTPASLADPCVPSTGRNRVYALRIGNGRPALDFNDDGVNDPSDDLSQSGIVGDVSVGIIRDSSLGNGGGGGGGGTPTVCIAGVEVLKKCVGVGGTVRSYWHSNGR
ncbi:MAG: PilC/PilY family type IV pilus protein [Steroidobacteraceae bacterium]